MPDVFLGSDAITGGADRSVPTLCRLASTMRAQKRVVLKVAVLGVKSSDNLFRE
tara:strand:+ start:738 stop:899 length:162 start_codon:yes stop_codon:yes gene_type:complete